MSRDSVPVWALILILSGVIGACQPGSQSSSEEKAEAPRIDPKIERALLTMNNVVLTPHLGSAVMELRERMAHVVVDNIAAIAEGRLPPNCINPAVFAPGA